MKSRFLIFAAVLGAGACEDLGPAPALGFIWVTS